MLLSLLLAATIEQSEICRFAAGAPENPFARWMTSSDITCVAAGSPLDFPPGRWNVFARSPAGISTEVLLIEGPATPASLPLSQQPAATIIPLLREGERAVIYAPRRGVGFPAAEKVRVPAGEELWLIAETSIVSVPALQPGSEHTIDARKINTSEILGWLHVPATDRAAIAEAEGLSSPIVQAGTHAADPLPPAHRLAGSFFRIRNVPQGELELSIGGRGWLPDRRHVKSGPALTKIAEPLTARASGSLIVNWGVAGDLPSLDRSLGACENDTRPAQFEITISSCRPPRRGQPERAGDCSPIRSEVFEPRETAGSVAVDEIAPGFYRAELKFGKLPPVSATATVGAARQQAMRLFAAYTELYGTVTHGGEPIGEDAVIDFPGGYGFATAEKSEYRAALLRLLALDTPITVAACDGIPGGVVFVDRPMRGRTRFDIDIPANEVLVTVTDTFTQERLAGATIRYTILSKLRRPQLELMTRTVTTGHDATAVIRGLPEREIVMTVSHPGYEKHTAGPFSLWKSEDRKIDVQLVPARGDRGRIVSGLPFENAAIYWYSEDGRETERAEVSEDGTFVHASSHDAGETMIVASQSHPLWVSRTPKLERHQSFQLRFPDGVGRHFDVWLAGADGSDSRFAGVALGNLRVPPAVLRQHQFLRGESAVIHGEGPLRVHDILETGPIEIALGPLVSEVPSRLGAFDLFALPEYAGVPRQRLAPGAASVTFEAP